MDELKIFSGNSNLELAHKICRYLKVPLGKAEIDSFSDGEIRVRINENVRGSDIFLIQAGTPPVNKNLMELLIMLDALYRASAKRITAVIPYYAYGRQDRKDRPRAPITAKLIANIITVAGANRVLTVDLHAGQIQGFFDIPVDHLFAGPPVLIKYFESLGLKNIVVVSPDTGSVKTCRALAKRLDANLAIIDKRRPEDNVSEVMNVIGEVKGRTAIIMDDMVDTGSSIINAAIAVKEKGARQVYAGCTHAVLSGGAVKKIEESCIEEMVITDTIPLSEDKHSPKIKVLSVAELLGEAIRRIHEEASVSSLFN
jgi:ribose-phosphate pyrophosphokinase